MAESTVAVESDLIIPYRFEPEGEWGCSEGSDDDSDHNDDSQTHTVRGDEVKLPISNR